MSIDHISLLVSAAAFILIVCSRLIFGAVKTRLYAHGSLEKRRSFQQFLERLDKHNILLSLWVVAGAGIVVWLVSRVVISYV